MEPTATPPPVEKGHVKRRRGAARPLGDVTNILPDTPANPTTRRPRPLPSDADTSACSATAPASATVTPVSKPSCSAAGATISAQSATGKPILPENFVKKQRAYFEEIDAFELPEEEASETDLE
ncbi:hypothetical protein E2562_007665 [Oryza meyeriana var. granulata]|uniref:Sororin C-terminal region domain-containing protein n=1 Tax=Oryza meyeriana var. granulata TaxID=110450 RepID=A0A6G1DW20_9ORYZ|nr:hypothetical protein E2562_007665 [Oryza meyeriana var. granulata]